MCKQTEQYFHHLPSLHAQLSIRHAQVINPFRDAGEPGPQCSFDTSHPVTFALVEEEFTPIALALGEQLFIRFRAVGIPRQAMSLPVQPEKFGRP
jgi:hypothetical protein